MKPDPTAAATVALAVFAAVQVYREIRRSIQRRASMRRRLRGVAWLARRSCEVTLRSAPGIRSDFWIAKKFTNAPAVDRLERIVLMRSLASIGCIPGVTLEGLASDGGA